MPAIRRVAVTGAPGAGKSTLLDELAERGVQVVREVARRILQGEGGMALRETDPQGFAQAMFVEQLAAWEAADAPLSIFDRGFADIVGFLWLEGLEVPADIDRACRELRFDRQVFHAQPWREIYTPDDERIQDWDAALASDDAVGRAWRHYGYDLVALPLVTPAERAEFVLRRL